MLPGRINSAVKRSFLYLVTLFSIAPLAVAGQGNSGNSAGNTTTNLATSSATNSEAWSGILVSSACNADEAFAESLECLKKVPGAKLALYDDTNRVIYGLEPQESLTAYLGDTVTVRGTLDDNTIHITSIELMSIGLAVGQKAPAFSARDQFGRIQTLDSLKGTNGTVLLFFRSADW
jgi:hypothetical protein